VNDADGHPSGSAAFDDAEVSRGLRALPRKLSMPTDVSIRIAAAIEAEAQAARERGTLDQPADAGRERDATAEPRGWFRRRAPQLLAGVAGLSVLTFGLYLAGSGGSGEDDATSADSGGESLNEDADVPDAPEAAQEEQSGSGYTSGGDINADEEAVTLAVAELSALASSVASTGAEAEPGCGRDYAEEIDATLLGSAEIDGGVLVVTTVEGTSTVEGWTLGWCDAAYPANDVDPVVVARPTP
jgi:hypothetical protein